MIPCGAEDIPPQISITEPVTTSIIVPVITSITAPVTTRTAAPVPTSVTKFFIIRVPGIVPLSVLLKLLHGYLQLPKFHNSPTNILFH